MKPVSEDKQKGKSKKKNAEKGEAENGETGGLQVSYGHGFDLCSGKKFPFLPWQLCRVS